MLDTAPTSTPWPRDAVSPSFPSSPSPRSPLDRFVAQIQVLSRGPEEGRHAVQSLPDGTSSVVFRWLRDGSADMVVCGPRTWAYYKTTPAIPLLVHVVFRPGGAYPFFGTPVDKLADRLVPLGDLWGGDDARVLDRFVAAAERGGDAEEVVRDALVARLRRAPFEPASARAARAAVAQISGGAQSIDAVAQSVGLSVRHLRRAFQATVGVGPRTFARIVRFQRALELGRAEPGRWKDVALATGYCDQAHLTAEFRKLARVSPGSFDVGRRPRHARGRGRVGTEQKGD